MGEESWFFGVYSWELVHNLCFSLIDLVGYDNRMTHDIQIRVSAIVSRKPDLSMAQSVYLD